MAFQGNNPDALRGVAGGCQGAIEVANSVISVIQGVIAALEAVSHFGGSWIRPYIAMLKNIIKALRVVIRMLESFIKVLNRNAGEQEQASNNQTGRGAGGSAGGGGTPAGKTDPLSKLLDDLKKLDEFVKSVTAAGKDKGQPGGPAPTSPGEQPRPVPMPRPQEIVIDPQAAPQQQQQGLPDPVATSESLPSSTSAIEPAALKPAGPVGGGQSGGYGGGSLDGQLAAAGPSGAQQPQGKTEVVGTPLLAEGALAAGPRGPDEPAVAGAVALKSADSGLSTAAFVLGAGLLGAGTSTLLSPGKGGKNQQPSTDITSA